MEPRVLEHDSTGAGEPPIVLLPGGLTGWLTVPPIAQALGELRRTVRIQPLVNAEGLAGRPGDPAYGADVERESLLRTLDDAGITELDLIGWSNGGRMALDLALAVPDRVRTLTLAEPAAWWLISADHDDARAFGEFIDQVAGRSVTDEDVEEFAFRVNLAPRGTDLRALPGWPLWSRCRQTLAWYGERAVRTAAEGIAGHADLRVPTLLVRGTRTAPWLTAVADHLAAALPDATIAELEGGHAAIVESLDGFVAAVADHLRRAEA